MPVSNENGLIRYDEAILVVGDVGGGQNEVNAGQGQRLAGIEVEQAGMGLSAEDDFAVKGVIDANVVRILSGAGHFAGRIIFKG